MQFPSLDELRARHTMKWTRYPEDVLPLWVAESDFSTCPPVKAALESAVERESFGYKPDCNSLGEATAEFYQSHYGFAARPDWVFPLPDVVRGLYVCLDWFVQPDTSVIVPLPAYPPFFQLLSATKREGYFIHAQPDGLRLQDIEAGFQAGARSILLANPFNPLGFTFSESWLRDLCHLADRYDARVLVDEIHAPLVYEGKHIVAAGIDDVCARVCITITATSKAWNTAGLKCAQIIFSNAEDVRTWRSLSPVVVDGVSTLGLVAAATSYREGQEFLAEELEYLRENRDFILRTLKERIPGIKVHSPAATYLLWLDCSGLELDGAPGQFFLENAKVALNEGAWFGEDYKHCVRLNFATSREILAEALNRMADALAKR